MIVYEIKRGNTVVWSGHAGGKQYRVIMQEDRVEITIASAVALTFRKGDTMLVYGQTYKINRPENIRKENTIAGYEYSIEFEALYYDFGKWTLYTLDKNNALKEPDVYVMGDATTILGLVIQNANRAGSGWTLGNIDATEVIQWTYSSAKLLSVLQDVADQTNLEFWFDGKELNLTRRQPVTGIEFEFGGGKELYKLTRSRRDKPVVTHMTVAGGSQNIPNGYGHRNIQPTGGNPMINPNYVAGMDRVEDVIVFENVYPRLQAKVTSLGAGTNVVRSTDLNFDLNAHRMADGTFPQIAFTSGLLNGFRFNIGESGYVHATRQILFEQIQDDNAYPQGVPNSLQKPAIGDTFVLLNIHMPATYVTAAENRVRELGQQYFAEEGVEQYDWAGSVIPRFIIENDIEFELGGLVHLKAEDIGFDGLIRISSYSRDLQESYRYEFTLSNVVTVSQLARQMNMSDRLANTINKGISSDGKTSSSKYADRAGYAETAGHAATATNAATANFANQAADSALWNGKAQPDYLNQPVRTTDNVVFARVTANRVDASQILTIPQAVNATANALSKNGAYLMLGNVKAHAGNSDLWNGLAQPDYVTQPVRPTDNVQFANVTTNSVSSPSFNSGWSGNGFRIAQDANGNYVIEVDRMFVRKDFNVYTLIVNELRSTNGSLIVSDGIEITGATAVGGNYRCTIDTDGGTIGVPFRFDDVIQCQVYNGQAMKYFVGRVLSVDSGSFLISILDGSGVPAQGDHIVRIDNFTNANRKGIVYITASDSGAPFIDTVYGKWTDPANSIRSRMGNLAGIVHPVFGTLTGFGVYLQGAYIDGVLNVQPGSNVYTQSQSDGLIATAKIDAISSASLDATSKANAARDAAVINANAFTQDAINAIEVGGRNKFIRSQTQVITHNISFELNHPDCPNGFAIVGSPAGVGYAILNNTIDSNGFYTVSGYVRSTQNLPISFRIEIGEVGVKQFYSTDDNRWTYFSYTAEVRNFDPAVRPWVAVSDIDWLFYYFKDFKIEKGNKATDWSPAPEDVGNAIEVVRTETNTQFNVLETEINSKVSQNNFNALNQRVSTAESTIVQQAGLIDQRVTNTEFAELNNTVGGINGRVTNAESAITQQAGQIELRATKTEVTTAINDIVEIKDTRHTNQPPSWYYDNYPAKTVREFKHAAVIGLGITGVTYVQLTTYVPWADSSGGNVVQEAVINSVTYNRNGVNSWTEWVEGESTAGAQLKANNAQQNAEIYTNSQVSIVDDAIRAETQRINGLTGRVESTEFKLQPDQLYAAVKANVDDATLATLWTGGKPLNPDPTFKEGFNGLTLYNNTGQGAVNWQRLPFYEFGETFPTTSGYGLYFHNQPARPSLPGWGGFTFSTPTRAKAKFLVRMLLAFEEGREIWFYTNHIGDGGSQRWLTPIQGRGVNNFAEYISYVECGTGSGFDTTNFFAFHGGGSVSVRVAFAGVYDITDAPEFTTKEQIRSSFLMDQNGIYLEGKRIDMTGAVTINSLKQGTANDALLTVNGLVKAERIDVDQLFAREITATGSITATNFNLQQGKIGPMDVAVGAITIGNQNSWIPFDSTVRMSAQYFLFRENGNANPKSREFMWNNNSVSSYKHSVSIKNTIDNNTLSGAINAALVLEARNSINNLALDITAGQTRLKGLIVGLQSVTSNGTVINDEAVHVNTSSNLTMPFRPLPGRLLIIKNIAGYVITLSNNTGASGIVNMNGSGSQTTQIPSHKAFIYVFDGSNWVEVSYG